MLSGLLVLVPFAVTLILVRWLFRLVTGLIRPMMGKLLSRMLAALGYHDLPGPFVGIMAMALSVLVLLTLIYLMGAIAQFVVGRRIIKLGEDLVLKIPLIGAVYAAAKQLVQAFTFSEKAALKSVVLVEFPRPGFKAVAFLTGTLQDGAGKTYCKVFIPTAPNPTTGFFQIVPVDQVRQTNMGIEDAFKMILSGGLIGPEVLEDRPLSK